MNIYKRKRRWKLLLLIMAIGIGTSSLWYTSRLVKKLSEEEKKKIELWAEATRRVVEIPTDGQDISFEVSVIADNTTIPVIWTDITDKILSTRNLDSAKVKDPTYIKKQIAAMKAVHPPIVINFSGAKGEHYKQFFYYRNSLLLDQLRNYPLYQLFVISLFLIVSYLAFSSSRKAEQNQVWVGLAKETAHQLGTPLSSLLAWIEYLKLKGVEPSMTEEIEKDVLRLATITERFSKIGSHPVLQGENIMKVMAESLEYLRTRSSQKVLFVLNRDEKKNLYAAINVPLFEWVVENICKNAIDAMNGAGTITVTVFKQQSSIYIDISDTGKGISKNKFKTIFKPGYTTKNRGWGLGLSLTKRIVEEYHSGTIVVKESEQNKGTTFRISLKAA
jgi:anti-sigma regulatory factor (Ser/Thr protein kinase)